MERPQYVRLSIQSFPARTPTLPPATHTNSYALGTRDVLLVEPATPYEDEQRAWIDWARGLASAGRNLVAIVVTHDHHDHVGGVDVLARELGVPVWAHAASATRMASVHVGRLLNEGDVLQLDGPTPERWRVLHTPGHAPGHVCLFEEAQRAVVVGDMVASEGTILVAPGEGDMRVYLEQLERLARLDVELALPAHGTPIESPTSLFRRYITHRLMREAKAERAVKAAGAAGATLDALLPVAYDDTPTSLFPLARLSLEAHLQKLVDEGRVIRREDRYVCGEG